MDSQGFWSYVHADDDADGERISRLAKDVAEQFEMLTGEKISLFLDKISIAWGDNWRDKIDSNLASVAFFIPVLTPRYFMSSECRSELQIFARRATRLGIKELVLPLLYVDVPSIHDEANTDDLIELVRTFQWEDWRELRFEEVTSKTYRAAVARLATRLVEANKRAEHAETTPIRLPSARPTGEADDASPGTLDQIADAEEALPKWTETLDAISREIELVGEIMQQATADITKSDAQGKGFAAKRKIVRHVAAKLEEPSQRVWSLGNEYATQLHEVDEGFRAIIEGATTQIQQEAELTAGVCGFFGTVRDVSNSSHAALENCQAMIDVLVPIEKMSRDLRPTLRRLRQGLTILVEGGDVIDDWVRLIDTSGVECEGPAGDAT